MIIRPSTRFLSAVEASAWNSKNSRAFSGRRMALIPNPTKIVAKTLAAMRRERDWEKFEVAMLVECALRALLS